VDQPQPSAIAVFNYAHSYAQSALTLEQNQTSATHWNAPIYFLYFHAIELYLKAFLVSTGSDIDELRKMHGHRVRPLAKLCQAKGVQISQEGEQIIALMTETDNVMSSRYIRIGRHTRLPFEVYAQFCLSLHSEIGCQVYEESGVTRIPVLKVT
jgi:HEPN domain-containing protein